jgi:hypothetical protein
MKHALSSAELPSRALQVLDVVPASPKRVIIIIITVLLITLTWNFLPGMV